MMKLFHLLLAGICTVTGLHDRIAGGEVASPGDYPYVVSVTENGRHICGGFIYSSRWIVTAASCVVGKSILELNVVAGQFNLVNPDVNEQIMDIFTIIPFPEYNITNKRHDIALINLTEDILFDEVYVDFIPFSEADNSVAGVVMGWGATFEADSESLNLRYAGVFVVPTGPTTPCGIYANPEFDTSIMMCGSPSISIPPGGSPCQYDEGSPLVQRLAFPANPSLVIPSAAGIFSKTDSCTFPNNGVYTRLSAYSSWLLDTAGPQPTRSHGTPDL